MIFTSFEYAGFFLVVLVLNWSLPRRLRPALLLVASYVFYASWSPSALVILATVTAVTYLAALGIPRLTGTLRAVATGATVTVAASSLIVFKVVEAFGLTEAARDTAGFADDFAVPVGLSFFSFQAISYVVDVHRKDVEPSRSVIDVSLYLAFFPHLLAGPIVRASKLIPAFHSVGRRPDPVRSNEAIELILVGTFKKVVLADPALTLIAGELGDLDRLGTVNALLSLTLTLVAAYFDVTGYIDIARGSAKLLGIDMQRNALLPLTKSTGYADFWRRWQLTVMMWFRDYIYRPLRGPGHQPARDHIALFGTFVALGIWHGLTFGWAMWGVISGILITVERTLQTKRSARRRAQTKRARAARSRAALPRPPSRHLQLAIALVLVTITFPLVAADSFASMVELYGRVLAPRGAATNWNLVASGVMGVVGLLLLDGREVRRERRAGHRDQVTVGRAIAFGIMVVGIIVYSGPTPQTFVYFSF